MSAAPIAPRAAEAVVDQLRSDLIRCGVPAETVDERLTPLQVQAQRLPEPEWLKAIGEAWKSLTESPMSRATAEPGLSTRMVEVGTASVGGAFNAFYSMTLRPRS